MQSLAGSKTRKRIAICVCLLLGGYILLGDLVAFRVRRSVEEACSSHLYSILGSGLPGFTSHQDGKLGVVYEFSFFTENDAPRAKDLEEILGSSFDVTIYISNGIIFEPNLGVPGGYVPPLKMVVLSVRRPITWFDWGAVFA